MENEGRQNRRTEIRRIESKAARATAFTKRRQGLFRKTQELCTGRGANAVVVVFSPQLCKPYSYGHPSVDSVMERFLNDNNASSATVNPSAALTHAGEEQQQGSMVEDRETATSTSDTNGGGVRVSGNWWEESTEGMDLEELYQFEDSLLELKKNLLYVIEEKKNKECRLFNFCK